MANYIINRIHSKVRWWICIRGREVNQVSISLTTSSIQFASSSNCPVSTVHPQVHKRRGRNSMWSRGMWSAFPRYWFSTRYANASWILGMDTWAKINAECEEKCIVEWNCLEETFKFMQCSERSLNLFGFARLFLPTTNCIARRQPKGPVFLPFKHSPHRNEEEAKETGFFMALSSRGLENVIQSLDNNCR